MLAHLSNTFVHILDLDTKVIDVGRFTFTTSVDGNIDLTVGMSMLCHWQERVD